MKIVNIFSTIILSVGMVMVIAAFVKTRNPVAETEKPLKPDDIEVPENDPPQAEGTYP